MQFDDSKIKQILLSGNYVEAKDIEKAEEYAKDHRGSLVEYLIGEDILSREILGQAIAESFGVGYSDLNKKHPTKEQVLIIPEDIAKKLGLSLRTFYRRLDEQGFRYRALLADTRFVLAKTYLQDKTLSLSEISLMLGYAEQSAFTRAFISWGGLSPSTYRNSYYGVK